MKKASSTVKASSPVSSPKRLRYRLRRLYRVETMRFLVSVSICVLRLLMRAPAKSELGLL